ncbi:beta-lactamase family protein [Nocardia sp. 2]|uniref:Beta-lactamase family protein n=1 Tax=Nocardia acididurans TaxID=2802282 RepID=A0ABS1MGP0_9NOCA|nr:serine hydrolase domain-containing protein [Nocardia acididurans]MBL1078383.1 beta-lactamase family protein [Nocardia acididurans]
MSGNNGIGMRALRLWAAVATAALLLVTGCGSTDRLPPKAFPPDVIATIDRIMQTGIDAGLIPGAAVSIIDPERGTFSRAYGFADVETGRRADVRDRYRVGSITKTFTAAAVLRLADEGKLSLDDHLSRYVDGIPNGDTITLRDLLGMRGGVYPYNRNPEFAPQVLAGEAAAQWTVEDSLRILRTHPDKATPPDTATEYSNSEYVLLGVVLEKVTGRPVRDVINGLAGDYGLTGTVYPGDANVPAPESHGYAYDGTVRRDVTQRTSPGVWGAAGMLTSTVTDLADYASQLGEGRLLRPETQRARTTFTTGMADGAPLEYGLGLMRAATWIGHTGGVLGYTAITMYHPDRKISVAVTVNQYTPALQTLLFLGAPSLWMNLAVALYPDTVPDIVNPVPPTAPAIPTPAELTGLIGTALDPAIPASDKGLRVEGDDADPELITKLARIYADASTTVTVDKVTDRGSGSLFATTTMTLPSGAVPMLIAFVPQDGAWRFTKDWVCMQVTGTGGSSPACA